MSQPPYDPYRAQPEPQYDQYGRGMPPPPYDPYGRGAQPGHGQAAPSHDPYGAPAPRFDAAPQGVPRQAPPPVRPAFREPAPALPSGGLPGWRPGIPAPGLLLTLVGFAVQIVSATVLPAVQFGGSGSASMLTLWRDLIERGPSGFGDWYVLLFSYPTMLLGVVLGLASVIESVALKLVWGGLALIGLGAVVFRYGLGPLVGVAGAEDVGTAEIVIAIVALVLLVALVFMLKMAVSMFRRIAGLVLLTLAGVHVWALSDLVEGASRDDLSFGAFGPAVGYLLIAVGAFIGPRRLPGV